MFCQNTIQLGDHPATSGSQITARLLTLTASLLTLLMFVYYTTDITSKMTVGESEVQIKNFEDVLSHQYKVVTDSNFHVDLLAGAEPGSAMRQGGKSIDSRTIFPIIFQRVHIVKVPPKLYQFECYPQEISCPHVYELTRSEKFI